MSLNESTATRLDCRGQQCPAPIMAAAKAARSIKAAGGGVLEISADDAAFPLDLRSWCRSAQAELLSLTTDGDDHLALVRVGPAVAATRPQVEVRPAEVPLRPTAAANLGVVSRPSQLDCLGMKCPQPILALSRFARKLPPGSDIEIVADDDAFALDVTSWCRTANATLIALDRDGDQLRARVRTSGVREAEPAAPPARASLSNVLELRLDDYPVAQWESELEAMARNVEVGRRVRVVAERPELSASIVQWCASTGHALVGLDSRGPVVAEVELRERKPLPVAPVTALAVQDGTELAPAANRCTLLVLHNDQEALLAALLVAVGAAAQGMEVVMFYTFWGLNLLRGESPNSAERPQEVSWMQRMLKWMMPKGPRRQALGKLNFGGAGKLMLDSIMKKNNIMSLPQLLDAAQEQGVRFIACTMSMQVMGITRRDLQARTNLEYGGVAAFVEAAHGSRMSLVF
jgi:TusA-related sulfurtransferase/peroxiredoxin family protein